jgi:hypothetical protein
MAKYKPSNADQMVMLPISLQDQLVPGTLEHTIHRLVEENIDLSVFDERYHNDATGARAIHPKILLKVILLAYAKGLINSFQIERACQPRTFQRWPPRQAWHRGTGLRQHLSPEAFAPLHPPLQTQSGCTMDTYANRARPQYRQDPSL